MATNLAKKIHETFMDLTALSPETIHSLIQEAMNTFTEIHQQTQSSDPKVKEAALKTAMALKTAIEAEAETLSRGAEMDSGSFASLAENEAFFTPETWAKLNEAKKELETLQNKLTASPSPSISSRQKRKSPILFNA